MSTPHSQDARPGALGPHAAGALACQGCRHLYSTWRPERPRGCRAYGFESAAWPAAVVAQSSGEGCTLFEARPGGDAPPPEARRRGTHEGGLYG